MVSSASATNLPLTGYCSTPVSIVGRPALPKSEFRRAQNFIVGPDYFHALQIPLMKGREFSESDNARTPPVAVVKEAFAQAFFPKGNVIGQRVAIGNQGHTPATIVGIVGNVLSFYGQFSFRPQVYESYLQSPASSMGLVLRSRAARSALASMLRRAVWSVDKDQPVGLILSMKEISANNEGGDRLTVALMGIFAGLALILAAMGIYGVMAYSVSRRTCEIGIRIALGVQKKEVLSLVLRQGGLLTAIGCSRGLLLALPMPRLFGATFAGFPVQGPAVAIAVFLIIGAVSIIACYISARRATKVDPMVALKYE